MRYDCVTQLTELLQTCRPATPAIGHELTLANRLLSRSPLTAHSRPAGDGSRLALLGPRCRLRHDCRLGSERGGHGVEQLERSDHCVGHRAELLEVRRLRVCPVDSGSR